MTGGVRLELVPTGKLKVDPSYQRELNERRVERMAGDWDDALAGAIHVAARNGSWYVADGQHRLAAARIAGVPELPAVVHVGLSPSDEARLFERVNTLTVRPSASDIFRARLEAGDETARAVIAAASEVGVTVELRGGGKDPRPLVSRSVATLQSIAKARGHRFLRDVLRVAIDAWPEEGQGLGAVALSGIAGFMYTYERHPRYDYDRIAVKLAERSVRGFLQRAIALADGSPTTGGYESRSASFNRYGPRRAVLEAYNRHLRSPLPEATQSDMKQIAAGRNPWSEK